MIYVHVGLQICWVLDVIVIIKNRDDPEFVKLS